MTLARLEIFPLLAPAAYLGYGDPAQTESVFALWDTFTDGRTLTQGVIRHEGADIGAAKGTLIRAMLGGRVTASRWSGLGGWAVMITSHGEKTQRTYETLYAHMLTPPFVDLGDVIQPGDLLGVSGATGGVQNAAVGQEFKTFPHLHVTTKINGVAWNPTSQLIRMAGRRLGKDPKYAGQAVAATDVALLTARASSMIQTQVSRALMPTWYVNRIQGRLQS